MAGHFSAYGMPDRPCVVSSACGVLSVYDSRTRPRSLHNTSLEGTGVSFRHRRVGYKGEGAQMAAASRKRRLSGEARRALELLGVQDGITEALMLAHGFTDRMLVRLARAGLITIRHEVIKADGKTIDVGRVWITEAGRRALEG